MASNVTIGKLNATVTADAGAFTVTLNQVIQKTEKAAAASSGVGRAMKKAGDGTSKFSSQAQQAAYLLDDLVAGFSQRGLSGAIQGSANNLTVMAANMGPMVGLFSAAGLAVAQLGIKFYEAKKGQESFSRALDEIAHKTRLAQQALDQFEARQSLDLQRDSLTGNEGTSELVSKLNSDISTFESQQNRLSAAIVKQRDAIAQRDEFLSRFGGNSVDVPQKKMDSFNKLQREVQLATLEVEELDRNVREAAASVDFLQEKFLDVLPSEVGQQLAGIASMIDGGKFEEASSEIEKIEEKLAELAQVPIFSFDGMEQFSRFQLGITEAVSAVEGLQQQLEQSRTDAAFAEAAQQQAEIDSGILDGVREFEMEFAPDTDPFEASIQKIVDAAEEQFSAIGGILDEGIRESASQSVLDAAQAALSALEPNIEDPQTGQFRSVGASRFGAADSFSLINRSIQGNAEDQRSIAIHTERMAQAMQRIQTAIEDLRRLAEGV